MKKEFKGLAYSMISTLILLSCTPAMVKNLVKDDETLYQAKTPASKNPEDFRTLGSSFVVATEGIHSSKVGVEIYRKGGNAVDAAVATSFALAVERPQSTGIAGGGFWLMYHPTEQRVYAIDFREVAPKAASEGMYLDGNGDLRSDRSSTDGIFAVAVPGFVAGMLEIHEKYGSKKLSRSDILGPAIAIAKEGFTIPDHLARAIEAKKELLIAQPHAKKVFFKNNAPLSVGDLLVQPELAKTLELIAKEGSGAFYKGSIAKKILRESHKRGGIIQAQDLSHYQVKYREPVHAKIKGFDIYSMSPPSSGGTHVIQILQAVMNQDRMNPGPFHPETIHYTSSIMQRAFADRATYMGDPDFAPKKVPYQKLAAKSYVDTRMQDFDLKRHTPSTQVHAGNISPNESDETTHFSLMDKDGWMVSTTQTINGWFGSGIMVEGAGFFLNNEMDDFSIKPGVANMFGAIGGKQNAIAAGKRPLSSMSPTIVLKDKKAILGLGSPSGTRIISCVALTLLNRLEYGMPLWQSVQAMRYHHQWQPDEIRVDEPFFNPSTENALKAKGHKIHNANLGCRVQAVAKTDSRLEAVADMRGDGTALGY
jgi:gamma-glutamyltranspeptidase / glutathione hydrolase